MKNAETRLSSDLIELLQGEKIVTLVTINAETKKPQLSVVSWVMASEDGSKVSIAVGHKGSTVDNIQADPYVILGTIGPETTYAITGQASVSDVKEGTMKYRLVTVEVEAVEDVIFYGGKITQEPAYEKTYAEKLRKQLDTEVYAMLKENLEA